MKKQEATINIVENIMQKTQKLFQHFPSLFLFFFILGFFSFEFPGLVSFFSSSLFSFFSKPIFLE
jgi:hypothetical protein